MTQKLTFFCNTNWVNMEHISGNALCSLTKSPFLLNVETESETGKDESTSMGMKPNLDITGADSDLAVLLNAWYAAGFYTGR
jgi:hypothetical protein